MYRTRRSKYSNEQLAAIFAELRKAGKLKIRPHVYKEAGGATYVKLILDNPLILQSTFKQRTGRTHAGLTRALKNYKQPALYDWLDMRNLHGKTYKPNDEFVLAKGYTENSSPVYLRKVVPGTTEHGPLTLVRTHSPGAIKKEWLRDQRLGTALYLTMYRAAKKEGHAGIYSAHRTRTRKASRVWKSISTGTTREIVHGRMRKIDYLTSVKPHAKRRGEKKRKYGNGVV